MRLAIQAGRSALWALLLCFNLTLPTVQGQPGLALPMLNAQPGDTILVPVRTQMLSGPASFELRIRFDAGTLHYLGLSLPSTMLAGAQPAVQVSGNLISLTTPGVSLPPADTVLLSLRFAVTGGPSFLIWDRSTRILPERPWQPIHGAVNPVATSIPSTNGNQSVCTFGIAEFRLTTSATGPFQWYRLSADGNQAQALSQSAYISGVNTQELSVQALSSADSGRVYYCRIGTTNSQFMSRPQSLRVLPLAEYTFSDTLCLPGTYSFGGFQIQIPGTYYDLLQSSSGCDSLVTLQLHVLSSATVQQSVSICENQLYSVGTQVFQQPGSYTIQLRRENGCDSTIQLNLTVLDTVVTRLQSSICPTDSLWFDNRWVRAQGTYTQQLSRTTGCDSLVILQLVHLPASVTQRSAAICETDSFFFAGIYRRQPGVYSNVLRNYAGCDSVVTLQLTVHPLPVATLTRSGAGVICPSDSSALAISQVAGSRIDWYFNGALIPGAHSTIYYARATGDYHAVLTDTVTGCSFTTPAVSLLVEAGAATFLAQPVRQYLELGSPAVFIAGSVFAYPQSKRWQIWNATSSTWLDLTETSIYSGTTGDTLSLASTTVALNQTRYRMKITGCQGEVYSQEADLVLHPAAAPIQLFVLNRPVCPGETVEVPVYASNFSNVGRINLSLQFDTTRLTFVNVVRNSGFGTTLTVVRTGGVLRFTRNNTTLLSLTNDTLWKILFRASSTPLSAPVASAVNWVAPATGDLGLASSSPANLIHRLSIQPGTLTIGALPPVITQQPVGASPRQGDTLSLTIVAQQAASYRWQQETASGWVDLNNTAVFSGVTSPTLTIRGVPNNLHNSRYRVRVRGACLPEVFSQSATLLVIPIAQTIRFSLGSAQLCQPGSVAIPVNVTNFSQIGRFDLKVDFVQGNLVFSSVTGIASGLSNVSVLSSPGNLRFGYSSITPYTLGTTGSGTLFTINFTSASPSALNWDSTTFGVGEVSTSYLQPLPRMFVNGSVGYVTQAVNIQPVSSLCYNSSNIQLQAAPAGGFFTGPAGMVTSNGIFNPAQAGAGTHVVQYSYFTGGCLFTTSYGVVVLPRPQVSAGADQTICRSTTAALTATGGVSYLWSTGATTPTIVVSPGTTTSYSVLVTDAAGCSARDTVVVAVQPVTPVQAGADQSVCPGGSVTLSASGAVQYFWSPSAGLSSVASASPVATPAVTTDYVVTGLNANGCITRDTVRVVVNPLPVVTVADHAVSFCAGTPGGAQLEATGALSYNWTPTTGLSNPSIANPVANPTVTTTYTVTGVDASGCSDTSAVTVYVPRLIGGASRLTCAGQPLSLSVGFDGRPGTQLFYQWSPATGLDNPFSATPVAQLTSSVLYTVVVTTDDGCQLNTTVRVLVSPAPVVDAGVDAAIAPGDSVSLQASVQGGVAPLVYSWSPSAGMLGSTTLSPQVSPAVTTTYYLTVSSGNGCAVTDSVRVVVDPNLTGKRIYGRLAYQNSVQSPLSNQSMNLRVTGGSPVGSMATTSAGLYSFQNIQAGSYTLQAQIQATAGGITTQDAFLINSYLTNPNLLSGLALQAADANGDGLVNSADALLVMQRSINSPSAVLATQWVSESPVVNLQQSDVQQNIFALSRGDANRSFVPGQRMGQSVQLAAVGEMQVNGDVVTIPVRIGSQHELAAFQLSLQLPQGVRIRGIRMPSRLEDVYFHQQGDVLHLGWFDKHATGWSPAAGEVLMELEAEGMERVEGEPFVLTGVSEATDSRGGVHTGVRLEMPRLTRAPQKLVTEVYPNPTNGPVSIRLNLPEAGRVEVVITDASGQRVILPMSKSTTARVTTLQETPWMGGEHTINVSTGTAAAGIYQVRIRYTGTNSSATNQHKLIVIR